MLGRVAPVMAVSCAAGVANYGLCVPAYAFAAGSIRSAPIFAGSAR